MNGVYVTKGLLSTADQQISQLLLGLIFLAGLRVCFI